MAANFAHHGFEEQPLEQYGAATPLRKPRPGRRNLNFAAVVVSLFVPWLLFCLMFSVMSFSLHYKDKMVCYLCVVGGLLFTACLAMNAWNSTRRPNAESDANWAIFLAAACLFAWVAGVAGGDINYYFHMEPFYDTTNLNAYSAVDPSKMPGQQVMDAGQIRFLTGTKLDLTKSMAFHSLDTYCVAPIVYGTAQSVFDFWAIGMNCCAGLQTVNDFACGEFNNPDAISGLRAMRDDQRPYFRLAVKQAESAFGIKAKHPLFFHWMQDPMLELTAYADEGTKYFLFGVYAFFAVMLFLVIAAAFVFSRN